MLTTVYRLPCPSTQWPIAKSCRQIALGIFNASCESMQVHYMLIYLQRTGQD